VTKLEKVYGDLSPTLIKLMDRKLTDGVMAVLSIHAEEVGQEILDKCGTKPLEGEVL
jgi:hypothetical protein